MGRSIQSFLSRLGKIVEMLVWHLPLRPIGLFLAHQYTALLKRSHYYYRPLNRRLRSNTRPRGGEAVLEAFLERF